MDAPDTFDLKTQDYRGTSDPEAALQELLACDARTPVDLVDGPVMRATLVTLGAQRHVLMMTAHHIICDGWSFNTVVEDLSALYTAAVNGTDAALADAPSFAQFAQTPALITPEPDIAAGLRYAAMRISPDKQWLVCVREQHASEEHVENELVILLFYILF